MADSIEQGVKEIIADIAGVEVGDINSDTNLIDDLDIDSIKAIEITVAIEKKFKISVRDEDVPKIMTFQEALSIVRNHLERKQSPSA